MGLYINIWIYLTKENYAPLFEKLRQKTSDGEVELIVNDVIISEWYRNKENTIQNLLKSITNEHKSTKNLIKFLLDEQKDMFNLLLEYISSNDKRHQKAELRVDAIEKLLLNSKKMEVTDEQKLFVAKMAIEDTISLPTSLKCHPSFAAAVLQAYKPCHPISQQT